MVHSSRKLSNASITKDNTFTMVFIDLDDTLIPTTIRNSLRMNFGIELFRIVDTTKLQSDIVNSLKHMQSIIRKYASDDNIQFALVSNASKGWIDDMLRCTRAYFPILGKYLRDNNIDTISATESTIKYLREKFGQNAKEVIKTTYNNNRFMYKYTTFRRLIHKYSLKLDAQCNRVISIGDGEHEHKALQIISRRNKEIMAVNIRFRKAPTFTQLQSQWKYVDTCFDAVISSVRNAENKYFEIDIDRKFNHDNNALCTGKYQLNAISLYFSVFMKMLQRDTKETRNKALEAVCKIVHSNLAKNDRSSPRGIQMKEMLRVAVKNQEFNKSISEIITKKKTILIST